LAGPQGVSRLAQFPQEQPDAHFNFAINFSLAGRGGHEVAAGQAFVKSHATHMDLLAFQRTGERDRIGCDLSDQVRAPAKLAVRWFAGLFVLNH
jgi:hypothetical protein